jgi:heme-degrading monooxygenase HmoA
MVVTVLNFKVEDYEHWRTVFDELRQVRSGFGCQGEQVFRGFQDRNELTVVLHWENGDDARQHAQSPELRDAQQRAGVIFDTVTTFLGENLS